MIHRITAAESHMQIDPCIVVSCHNVCDHGLSTALRHSCIIIVIAIVTAIVALFTLTVTFSTSMHRMAWTDINAGLAGDLCQTLRGALYFRS